MQNKCFIKNSLLAVGRVLLAILLGLLICALLSCSKRVITQEIPVMVHDSIRVVQYLHRVDTLQRVDSVVMLDTLYLDTATFAGLPILRHDRITKQVSNAGRVQVLEKVDTITQYKERPVTITKTETIEVNRLRWWQAALIWVGVISIVIVLIRLVSMFH